MLSDWCDRMVCFPTSVFTNYLCTNNLIHKDLFNFPSYLPVSS